MHRAAPRAARRSPRRRRPRTTAHRGSRRGRRGGPPHRRASSRSSTSAKQRVLGVFRALPRRRRTAGAGRQESGSARTRPSPPRRHARRPGWRSGRGRARAARHASGCRSARVKERLGSLKSETRGQPDRDPRARHAVRVSAATRWPKPRPREPAALAGPRGLARRCRSSPSIRPTPRITTTRCYAERRHRSRQSPAAIIVTVAIADVAHYVRPGSALDREALERGNSVYFPDRVVPMLPERISNDLCSLRPHEDRAGARRPHGDRRATGASARTRSTAS